MILHLALAALLQATPMPSPSTMPSSMPSTMPSSQAGDAGANIQPEQVARAQFAAFASGKIDQSQYAKPIPQSSIAQLHQVLPALGAPKSFTLLKQGQTAYGPGWAYKVTCEKGAVLEQFTMKDGKITQIVFSPAQ